MAKKILAIFFVSILLCSYIIPTTSAFADVVIGDNDSYAVTELGIVNGKKIATMEAMLQLLESGVSEINFNDVSDLEDYLEEFYDELTNVNYTDVSNEILAGSYNDVKELKQWIDDRGEYIATYYKDYLNSADEGLSNIFNQFQMKLPKSRLVATSLNGVRGLSRFDRSSPVPEPDVDYIGILNYINPPFFVQNPSITAPVGAYFIGDYNTTSFVCGGRNYGNFQGVNGRFYNSGETGILCCSRLDVYVNFDASTNMYYVTHSLVTPQALWSGYDYETWQRDYIEISNQGSGWYFNNRYQASGTSSYNYNYLNTSTSSLQSALEFIRGSYSNINLYVNGDLWLGNSSDNAPTLDIDGFIKLYGNDNPIQYEFPQGTQIDYNALYTTIYNAIRDNLPLDMQTVNNNQVYYDSHDTVYSPTIYNYYGKDGDDENDWIDSILDYATIPDFNSVLGTVAVLDAPFVNGITIVNAGVTDVIPTEILIILGAGFVLVLFVCIINRMSE